MNAFYNMFEASILRNLRQKRNKIIFKTFVLRI